MPFPDPLHHLSGLLSVLLRFLVLLFTEKCLGPRHVTFDISYIQSLLQAPADLFPYVCERGGCVLLVKCPLVRIGPLPAELCRIQGIFEFTFLDVEPRLADEGFGFEYIDAQLAVPLHRPDRRNDYRARLIDNALLLRLLYHGNDIHGDIRKIDVLLVLQMAFCLRHELFYALEPLYNVTALLDTGDHDLELLVGIFHPAQFDLALERGIGLLQYRNTFVELPGGLESIHLLQYSPFECDVYPRIFRRPAKLFVLS